jgi:hypothetical protein
MRITLYPCTSQPEIAMPVTPMAVDSKTIRAS